MRLSSSLLTFIAAASSLISLLAAQHIVPATRVVRLQIDYDNADISTVQRINKWNSIMRNSVMASLRFINKHWLICGGEEWEKTSTDCGKAQITGEIVNSHHYRINVTFISERDPVKNAKVEATSTVFAVSQIGLKGGIFQYTNALKVLGKPTTVLGFDEEFFCYRGATLVEGDKCHVCLEGEKFDDFENRCLKCSKGTYQDHKREFECKPCPDGKTTATVGTKSKSSCIQNCPPGSYFEESTQKCEQCGVSSYQDEAGTISCKPCPPQTVALEMNSTSIEQCVERCPAGSQRDSTGFRCLPCPIGTFKTADLPLCVTCPKGLSTLSVGAKNSSQCNIKMCLPGTFLNATTLTCEPCDYGLYSSEYNGRICKACPINTTTYQKGSNSVTQCESTNQCRSGTHRCHWLAACTDLPDEDHTRKYFCKCRPGFIGNGFHCADACDNFCRNGGSCLKIGNGEPRCLCNEGFRGIRCQIQIMDDVDIGDE